MTKQRGLIDRSKIEVVPRPFVVDTLVGDFGEAADMAIASIQEHCRLIERAVVIGAEMRCRRLLIALCVHERGDRHSGNWRGEGVAGAQSIAVQLEIPPERGELRSKGADVAGLAGLP